MNEQVVKSAGPGIVWDSNLTGFGLRTGKRAKTFIVLVGSGRRKRIGRYPLMSVAAAREVAKKLLAQKALGAVIPKHASFEEVRKAYLEDCVARVRPGTLRNYTWMLAQLDFGKKAVGDVTGQDMLRVLSRQTPSNKEHIFRCARTFFVWAFRNHLIDRSPLERLEPPARGAVRERVLTDEELGTVYSVASRASTSLHKLVWLLCRTGQRPGEIKGLQRQFIAPSRITLPAELCKNGREHTFPISEETWKFIEAIPQVDGSPYLFPSARGHGRKGNVMRLHVEEFKKECGIAAWQLRDLRKTFATGLQKLGVRTEVIEASLNHVSGTRAGIVGVYQRYNFWPEMVEAEKLWSAHLQRIEK